MLPLHSNPAQRQFDFARRAAPRATAGGWMRRQESIMGTAISVELWSEDRREGEAAMDS